MQKVLLTFIIEDAVSVNGKWQFFIVIEFDDLICFMEELQKVSSKSNKSTPSILDMQDKIFVTVPMIAFETHNYNVIITENAMEKWPSNELV